ncbi:hypothetical protein UFOVP60_32 [uncultured Caudovirales phage]|uniref:Uncharacterized protein n=1 Tax=uncultured Caudovirales phage TaxID=2100421 RepID=A0A6J5T9G5_9CAUD|nr:hypothetical protein UFOVP60_32 [uncultured Caudovirales phage]
MSKVFYFKKAPTTPVRVVKDERGTSGCASCFFHDHPGGCPERKDEFFAGSGYCMDDQHHYELET